MWFVAIGSRLAHSLRGRLILGFAGLLFAVVLALSWLGYHRLHARIYRVIDAELQEEVAEFRYRALHRPPTSGWEAFLEEFGADPFNHFDAVAQSSTHYLFTEAETGRTFSSADDPGFDPGPVLVADLSRSIGTPAAERFYTVAARRAGRFRVLAAPIALPGQPPGTIRVAISLRDVDGMLRNSLVQFGAGGLLLMIVSGYAVNALAWMVLDPVERISSTAERISRHDIHLRLPEPAALDEVGRLTAALNHMIDRLQAAYEEQQQFISDVSHELRTPITIVRGHLEVLGRQKKISPAELRETSAIVLDELERMKRLVDDLLLLVSATRPGFVRRDAIDAKSFMAEVFAKASRLGDRRWLLQANADGTLEADRNRLTQLLLNLAQNAVQHTTPGAKITLGLGCDETHWCLWVADTGEGIPAEELPKIFRRFYRVDRSRTREAGRVGLGLAIADSIVRAHGGRLTVESRVGAGSTFRVLLPRTGAGGDHLRSGFPAHATVDE